MLQAKTEEQKARIKEIFGATSTWEGGDDGIYIDDWVSYDEMASVVDYLRTLDKEDTMFEECWVTYLRKGSKKKSREYWRKLTDKEKAMVLPHIKSYVASRERQYMKDFERYLRDKTFNDIVSKGNAIIYDPSHRISSTYTPQGRSIWFNEDTQSYWSDDNFYYNVIEDGYNDDNRPDGATITLNNARGTITWDIVSKKWNRK